eukprot:TRINITY_DN6759_c0_g1_i1.p1 TRINITY_DN6759_c0_g1~~TRINITY_DN6759_c0_g1_i1.p1  ORF type:complete len:634 (+),score=73.84 TRINITY_DN6759_c0_g1_i1:234-1904(+)
MKTPEQVEQMWPKQKYPKPEIPLGAIWTDDTQMSMVIIESYLKTGTLDRELIKTIWLELGSSNLIHKFGEKWQRFQMGLFRGTGKNFRETIYKIKSQQNDELNQDISKPTAGNGAAMRCTPIAINAWKKSTAIARLEALRFDVLVSSSITHNHVFGITPAFAFAYLLHEWVGPKGETFAQQSTCDQLFCIAKATRQFEFSLLTPDIMHFLRQGDRLFDQHIHVMSDFFQTLAGDIEKLEHRYRRDIVSLLAILAQEILGFAKKHTSSNLTTPADGFALCSVPFAMVVALICKDCSFMSVLHYTCKYGGDTDTVGAMLGALLGARIGNNSKTVTAAHFIPPPLIHKLICHDAISQMFEAFIAHVFRVALNGNPPITCLELETMVTERILRTAVQDRPPHYRPVQKNPQVFNPPAQLQGFSTPSQLQVFNPPQPHHQNGMQLEKDKKSDILAGQTGKWQCTCCNFFNVATAGICNGCSTAKPQQPQQMITSEEPAAFAQFVQQFEILLRSGKGEQQWTRSNIVRCYVELFAKADIDSPETRKKIFKKILDWYAQKLNK